MKVIETLWFTNKDGCIGIVVVEEDVTGDRNAYIGPVSGTDEKADSEQLLAWGNKFSLDTAQRLEHHLTNGAATRLRESASELFKACKAQHQAMDILFKLIQMESGQPWEAVVQTKAAIDKVNDGGKSV